MKKIISLFCVGCIVAAVSGCGDTLSDSSGIKDTVADEATDIANDGGGQSRKEISEDYEMYPFQMDMNEIIEHYHSEGYDNVYLTSHELEAPKEGKIGDPGTMDIVYFEVEHQNTNALYSYKEYRGNIYNFWSDDIGWTMIYEETEGSEADLSGFSDTYWKLRDNEHVSDFFNFISDDALEEKWSNMWNEDYAADTIKMEAYIHFKDMSKLEYSNADVYYDGSIGDLLITRGEDSYLCEFGIDEDGIKFDNTAGEWDINFYLKDLKDNISAATITYYENPDESGADYEARIVPIEKDEYEKAAQGIAESSAEEVVEESEMEDGYELSFEEICGAYVYDNGSTGNCTAEILYNYNDEEASIFISNMGYGGHEIGYYEGCLEHLEGNTYRSANGEFGAELEIEFSGEHMELKVLYSDMDDVYFISDMAGKYRKEQY